jgi:carbamoyltransferase
VRTAEPARVVLGYSGLDGSKELKLRHFPGLDEREQRLFQGLDSAAALLVDGELVAAVQQERFSGEKFDHAFPVDAIRYCLYAAGVEPGEVDVVAHNFDYSRLRILSAGDAYARTRYEQVYAPARQTELLHRFCPEFAPGLEVRPVDHHRAHALSAAIPSGFDEALIVVADGMGEVNAITIHEWRNGQLRRLAALDFRSSLGLFYSLLTMHLGFWPNSDEYKVMALAAGGDPDRFGPVMESAVAFGPDGHITAPILALNRDQRSKETFSASRAWLSRAGCAGRDAGGPLTPLHRDIAAAAQRRVEDALFHLVRHWAGRTGLSRVAFAGGVALNCVAIGKLAASGLTEAIYVQPAAGDEGTAVGSALAFADPAAAAATYPALTFLGPDVTRTPAPVSHPYWSAPVPAEAAARAAARLLAGGHIVGWARDRLEFGPRALGNRSILADPRRPETRDRVNAAVKFREGFRPLAPAVKAEAADRYFDIPAGANVRHMTVAVPARATRRSDIAAVVHDDGTSRVQVVLAAEHPVFWSILDHFERLTGVPVLMNTSLNVKGQPTARDAAEAYVTFDSSHLDVAFIGDVVYAKPEPLRAVQAALAGDCLETVAG